MDSPYQAELRAALAAVQAAAQLSRAVLAAADKGVLAKDDLSPVTVADFAIQALLTCTLDGLSSSSQRTTRFVGEESAAALRASPALLDRVWALLQQQLLAGRDAQSESDGVRIPADREATCAAIDRAGQGVPGPGGRAWVFDPIDGTKTFVRGEMYAVNVAMLEAGRPVLGVVACPLLAPDARGPITNDTIDPAGAEGGCILYAVRGHGTWVRPLRGGNAHKAEEAPTARRLDPVSAAVLRNVTCATMGDSGIEAVHRGVAARLGLAYPGTDLLGWVPRWAALALGLGSVTVWVYKSRGRHAKIWDHAGAALLFEEVGGRITDVDGREVDWAAGRELTRNYGFVAAPAPAHAEVLRAVHETMTALGLEVRHGPS